MTIRRSLLAACTALLALAVVPVHARDALRPDQVAYRDLFRELVETNTTLSAGSCTDAAAKMAARLRKAGLPEADLHPFAVPEHPQEGGLVAVLQGQRSGRPAHPPAGPHRRGRSEARGLDARSIHPGRGKRLLLCARRRRRQGDGVRLGGHLRPVPAGRLQAAPNPEARTDVRRGNEWRVQWGAIPVDAASAT